jgi:hypothetical protein
MHHGHLTIHSGDHKKYGDYTVDTMVIYREYSHLGMSSDGDGHRFEIFQDGRPLRRRLPLLAIAGWRFPQRRRDREWLPPNAGWNGSTALVVLSPFWVNLPLLDFADQVPTFAVQTQKKLEPHHHIAPKGFRKVIFSRILYFSILFHSTFLSFRGVLHKKPADLSLTRHCFK